MMEFQTQNDEFVLKTMNCVLKMVRLFVLTLWR